MAADSPENMLHALKKAFEKLATGYCIIQDGAFRHINQGLAELCGCTIDDMMAAHPEDLVVPDDRSLFEEGLRRTIAGEAEPVRCRFRMIAKNGRIRTVEVCFAHTVYDGRPAAAGVLLADVPQRGDVEENETKYRLMFENATEGIFQTTPEGRCLAANPAFARMFGYGSAEEVVTAMTNVGLQLYANPGRREEVRRLLEEAGEIQGLEIEAIRKYGARIWISINAHVVRDETGAVRLYEGTFQDITDRKRVEQELRESEERYRTAIEHSNDGVTLIKDGRIIYVNQKCLEALGYDSADELLGKTLTALVHPDELPMVERYYAQRSSGAPAPTRYEVKGIRKDGTAMFADLSVAATTYRGEAVTLVYARDITDKKQAEQRLLESEERYRTAIEHSNDGVALIKDGRHIYVNRKYLDIHGYDSADEVLGKTLAVTVHPDDLERVERTNELRSRGEPSPERYELKGIRKDGSVIFVEISVTAIMYRGETVTLAYARDITARKRADEALRWKTALFEAQVNASIDGILVVDKDHRRIIVNGRLVEMLGIPQAVLDDEDQSALVRFLMGRTKNPEQFLQRVTYLYKHPSESSRDEIELENGMVFDRYSAPVLGDDGYYYGRIWAFRDITEVKRYWHILEDLSTTDGLTGISNRRRFDEFLGREWRSCMREGRQISLLFIDIDYFKQFNDLYGHLAGDDCLRKIATALQTTARRGNDMAARYGGEEFACVLPGTGKKNAVLLARKIIARTAALNVPHEDSSVAPYVTVSIGVATVVPSRGQHYSYLIDAADRSLYSAKQQGRNRVVACSEELRDPLHALSHR